MWVEVFPLWASAEWARDADYWDGQLAGDEGMVLTTR